MASSTKVGGEYGEIRSTIDVDALNAWLAQCEDVRGKLSAPVQVKQFKYGQSNPTYFLTDTTGTRFVLRKKPGGTLLSSTAHQVEREYRMLAALNAHNARHSADEHVPVPDALALCEDTRVLGTPFYVMEFLDGRIFTDMRLPQVPPPQRRAYWLAAVRALARLGALDPGELGLDGFAPRAAYFPRQVRALGRVSAAQADAVDKRTGQRVGAVPGFEEMVRWFQAHLPDEARFGPRVVHGDFKMDNLVFHKTEARVIGILDWELCTLGSPLADFANLTQPWAVDTQVSVGQMKGFKGGEEAPCRLEELEEEYCALLGQRVPRNEWVFAQSWMLFRLSIIAQGIAARHARGQASSERADEYAQMFPLIGRMARDILVGRAQL